MVILCYVGTMKSYLVIVRVISYTMRVNSQTAAKGGRSDGWRVGANSW